MKCFLFKGYFYRGVNIMLKEEILIGLVVIKIVSIYMGLEYVELV